MSTAQWFLLVQLAAMCTAGNDETVDIAPYSKSGNNVLAAVCLEFWGRKTGSTRSPI